MKKVSRRNFIKAGAMAGAAMGTPSIAQAGLFNKIYRSSSKALVVGSGFGGSVASLRLAEAGIPTMLIERGKHWKYVGEDSYPVVGDAPWNLSDEFLWIEPNSVTGGSVGMLQEYAEHSMPVGVGACLGGGSMVYGGVLLQPRREIFEAALPFLSYDDMDKVYYPRLLSRVSGGPIPDDILDSPNYTAMRSFIENATRAGMEVVRSEVGFNWDIIREEVQGKRTPFASIGEYVLGCNSGAKNTLDRNYLVDAVATGNLDIRTLHNVKRVRRKPWSSNYEVYCDVLNEQGAIIATHIIECQYLFMAAGSIHTTRLMLKAKAMGDIRGLNDGVGEGWAGNGDELMGQRESNYPTGPVQGGPPSIAAFDLENPYKPTGFMHSPALNLLKQGTQLQMGMVVPDQTSRASYNWLTDGINFNYSRDANQTAHNALIYSMEKLVSTGGGSVVDMSSVGTWHPLGGMPMNMACDQLGRVYGAPNLFVVDGSCIPGSSGAANPSLTIGANAERMMEALVPQLV